MNQAAIQILQIISAVLLIAAILMQNRGSGLGSTFGGGGEVYRTKRGAEKFLFKLTVVLAFVFLALAIAGLIFYQG